MSLLFNFCHNIQIYHFLLLYISMKNIKQEHNIYINIYIYIYIYIYKRTVQVV